VPTNYIIELATTSAKKTKKKTLFDKYDYLQTFGTAMGTPLGPLTMQIHLWGNSNWILLMKIILTKIVLNIGPDI
jgi:hypothetical protein